MLWLLSGSQGFTCWISFALVFSLDLSSWCLMMVEWLFLTVPWDCLRFVIVVFPDHTHYFLFTVESLSLLYLLFIS